MTHCETEERETSFTSKIEKGVYTYLDDGVAARLRRPSVQNSRQYTDEIRYY